MLIEYNMHKVKLSILRFKGPVCYQVNSTLALIVRGMQIILSQTA